MKNITCKECQFKVKNPADPINPKSFICVRFPPTVIPMMAQTNMGTALTVGASFPPVQNDSQACGEHKKEVVNLVA